MVLPTTRATDRVETIRRHRFDTTAFLVAVQPNCLGIAALESQKVTGRRLKLLAPNAPPSPDALPASWVVAVLLCPGDSTTEITKWARRLPAAARSRIWFYEAPTLDVPLAYGSWKDAGLGNPLADAFADFLDFNRLFANDLNEQIYQDYKPKT